MFFFGSFKLKYNCTIKYIFLRVLLHVFLLRIPLSYIRVGVRKGLPFINCSHGLCFFISNQYILLHLMNYLYLLNVEFCSAT